MQRGQILILLVAAAVIGGVALLTSSGGKGGGDHPASGETVVTLAASPEKLDLMNKLAHDYNRSQKKVFVEVKSASSGDEATAIARASRGSAGDKPTVWSPASSLWGRLLDHQTDRPLVPDTNPSIVRTPLVIAMWEPEARALGWPRKQIGFGDLERLAAEPRGWASVGHPEFGAFKLVHTNPDVSTSGLEAVTAEYYATTGKREGLTVADVDRPSSRAAIQRLERAIVHYGDTTLFIADQLRAHGPAYASAVAMEEVTLVGFNQHRGGQPRLVALYPKDGTYFSDSPYIVLRAPWVTAAQRSGATAFQRYLASHVTPALAGRFGFRPAAFDAQPVAPIDAAHGADPAQPTKLLSLPDPEVLSRVQGAWRRDRKPANVLLVVDTSGSMSDSGKLEAAKRGLDAFFTSLSPRDRVGLTTFSDQVKPLVPVTPFASDRAQLKATVTGLFAEGQTSLYDATEAGVKVVSALNDSTRINAVVVLTDGQDTGSSLTADDLVRELRAATGAEGQNPRVFTIAYGSDADRNVLKAIADASGGEAFDGTPSGIVAVYRSISSFF